MTTIDYAGGFKSNGKFPLTPAVNPNGDIEEIKEKTAEHDPTKTSQPSIEDEKTMEVLESQKTEQMIDIQDPTEETKSEKERAAKTEGEKSPDVAKKDKRTRLPSKPFKKWGAPQMSEHQKLENNLHEIFQFYSKHHVKSGLAFEEVEESMNKIDLGEFT